MGGAVSAGANNDELVDNLLEAGYIKTAVVERVFRAVDRGHYFTVEFKERAYVDIAWKCGNLHISAPCVYSKVMENLKLAPGLSFLNLGSGTGYLSTMAGLILGPYGINHAIEIHEEVLDYATKKLEEFVLTSSAMDEYEFCEPKFVHGNCLHLGSGARQYDRVYCSAACPENYESYLKNLIKVGGILVVPINDQLLQIKRTSDTKWKSKCVLPVSFATLVPGKSADVSDPLKMPDADPLSLQDICRFVVRSILRRNISMEHPELKKPLRLSSDETDLSRLLIPMCHRNSADDEEDLFNRESENFVGRRTIFKISPLSLRAIRARLFPQNFQSSSAEQGDQESAMEEDSNSVIESGSSSDDIFDETSESDFEEAQNTLGFSETSTSTVTWESDSEGGKRKLPETKRLAVRGEIKNRSKPKQEKMDSGIMEDMEHDGERSSDIDLEEYDQHKDSSRDEFSLLHVFNPRMNTRNFKITVRVNPEKKKFNPTSVSDLITSSDSSLSNQEVTPLPPNVTTYTTHMKEKIQLLPLPMTLKQYLNLNREF